MLRSLILSAAAAALAAYPAAARDGRRPLSEGSGMVAVVGNSHARTCYEGARTRNSSAAVVAECDTALRSRLNSHNRLATLVNRSIVLTERGEYDAALADLNAALGLRRRASEGAIHMNFGEVYTRMRRWDSAEDSFTRALELSSPTPHRAYFGRAIVREENGDIEGAYADYIAAAEAAPRWMLPRRELTRFQLYDPPGDPGDPGREDEGA